MCLSCQQRVALMRFLLLRMGLRCAFSQRRRIPAVTDGVMTRAVLRDALPQTHTRRLHKFSRRQVLAWQ